MEVLVSARRVQECRLHHVWVRWDGDATVQAEVWQSSVDFGLFCSALANNCVSVTCQAEDHQWRQTTGRHFAVKANEIA